MFSYIQPAVNTQNPYGRPGMFPVLANRSYLDDPADNLAQGQVIHQARTNGTSSYVVPFANKPGAADPNDPACAGLGLIETAIATEPLHVGGSRDPISNRPTLSELQRLVIPDQWAAITIVIMIKASIKLARPALVAVLPSSSPTLTPI
ncbi:hypothetical protein NZK33_09885 [Cyanobium sp. FGCU-6]|nr:hypothetical protein [Cyanobium sp. FGCU6]